MLRCALPCFSGFHKRSHQSRFTKFQHPHFKRGQVGALHLIKRKSAEANANFKDNLAQLTAQVTDLRRQYDDLYKIQQQILYIFARYMKAYPLPPQIDAAPLHTGPSTMQLSEERGGKRQRLLGDGLSAAPYSSIAASTVSMMGSTVSAPPITASTLAALLSSTSPMSSLSAAGSVSLSARDQELAELTALQSVLSQIPAGQALLGSYVEPLGHTLPAPSTSYAPSTMRPSPYAPSISPPHPPGAVMANGGLDVNSLAALSGAGGPLSHINPLILGALGALGGASGVQQHAPPPLPPGHQQRTDNVGMAGLGQLSGLSSLSALPPLSSLSSSSPPLSAQDLLQLLQHAHPSNRASRLSAIRQEQRMLEDDDDDDDLDDDGFEGPTGELDNGGFPVNGTSPDWLSATVGALAVPLTAPVMEPSRYVTLTSPPHSHTQSALDKSLSGLYSLPSASTDVCVDSYTGAPMYSDTASAFAAKAPMLPSLPLKTQEVGSLYSHSADGAYFSHLHNQLAAGSASQNASSSVSMSTSTVSGTTPLHLKPSSSIPLDNATLQSLPPALQATLQSTLAQLRVSGGSTQPLSLSMPSHSSGSGGAYGGHRQGGDAGDMQSSLALVSQLQAIANVSKQLQSLHHPSLTSTVHPSTSSPPFGHPAQSPLPSAHPGYHPQRQQQQQQQHLFNPPSSQSTYDEFGKGKLQQQQLMLTAYGPPRSFSSMSTASSYGAAPGSQAALFEREVLGSSADAYFSHTSRPFSMGQMAGANSSSAALMSAGHMQQQRGAQPMEGIRNPIL